MKTAMESDELRRLVEEFGWTQARAAKEIGIAPRTLGYYLNGRRIPEPVAFTARIRLVRSQRAMSG